MTQRRSPYAPPVITPGLLRFTRLDAVSLSHTHAVQSETLLSLYPPGQPIRPAVLRWWVWSKATTRCPRPPECPGTRPADLQRARTQHTWPRHPRFDGCLKDPHRWARLGLRHPPRPPVAARISHDSGEIVDHIRSHLDVGAGTDSAGSAQSKPSFGHGPQHQLVTLGAGGVFPLADLLLVSTLSGLSGISGSCPVAVGPCPSRSHERRKTLICHR